MIKKIKRIFFSLGCCILGLFIRRKKDHLAFGSWEGKLYIDNSRYLFEYILKTYKNVTLIWIGNESVKNKVPHEENVKVYRKNSVRSVFALLKCQYMFCSQTHEVDLCSYNVYTGAIITYLHHGMPLKKWGADSAAGHSDFRSTGIKRVFRKLIAAEIEYQYFVTSSPYHDKTNLTALDYRGCTEEKNVHSGTPRNDMLINYSRDYAQALKKRYAEKIGFDEEKKVILYLPTYRRQGTPTRSFSKGLREEEDQMLHECLLLHNAVLIEKNHYAEDKRHGDEEYQKEDVIHLNQNVNIQEMLLFTDILISDYSGAFLDFVLLDRPVILYAYDYEEYKNRDSGLYYSIEEFAAGRIVKDVKGVTDSIALYFANPTEDQDLRRAVRNKFMSYEKGIASPYICEMVFKDEIETCQRGM